jgi:predicted GNAT family acetyltransferase
MRTNIIINSNKGEVQAFEGDVQVGQINFNKEGGVLSIEHTEVIEAFARKGVAGILVQAATDYAVHHNLKIKPVCSYAQHWYKHNRQYKDILIEQE